jgi:hypothetical protein
MFYSMEILLAKKAVEPFYKTVINGLQKDHMVDKLNALVKVERVSVDNLSI